MKKIQGQSILVWVSARITLNQSSSYRKSTEISEFPVSLAWDKAPYLGKMVNNGAKYEQAGEEGRTNQLMRNQSEQ